MRRFSISVDMDLKMELLLSNTKLKDSKKSILMISTLYGRKETKDNSYV